VLMSHGSRNQHESGSDAFWNARRRQRLRFDFYCLGSAAIF
jgi:hypothetical protein